MTGQSVSIIFREILSLHNLNYFQVRRHTMSFFKKLFMILVVTFLVVGIYGCKKEGRAERAGKSIDNVFDSAKEKLDDSTK